MDGLIRRLNVTREAKALLTSDVDRDTSIAETRNDRHTLTRSIFEEELAPLKIKPIVDRIINERDNDVADESTTNDDHGDFSDHVVLKSNILHH